LELVTLSSSHPVTKQQSHQSIKSARSKSQQPASPESMGWGGMLLLGGVSWLVLFIVGEAYLDRPLTNYSRAENPVTGIYLS